MGYPQQLTVGCVLPSQWRIIAVGWAGGCAQLTPSATAQAVLETLPHLKMQRKLRNLSAPVRGPTFVY